MWERRCAPTRLLAAFVLLFSWLPLHIRLGSLDYVNYGFVHAFVPTPNPSPRPTPVPTAVPTARPSPSPSPPPSPLPSIQPTPVPTGLPTFNPTYLPGAPTFLPSTRPTVRPTIFPTRTSQPTNPGLPGDPQVVSWSLSLASGLVVIQFNQIINPATFRISRLSIIPARQASYPFDTAVFLTSYVESSFMNADIETPVNETIGYGGILIPQPVIFFMSSDDYAAMLFNPITAIDRNSSYLVIRQGAIQSFTGRPNKELNQSTAMQASEFVAETPPPFVVAAGIDYDKGFVTLTFSVPIGGSTGLGQVMMAGLTVQSAADCSQSGASALFFCKGAVVFVPTPDSYRLNVTSYARVITYFIGMANINAIKRVRGIADSVANTFFSATRSIVNDTKGNPMDTFLTGFNLGAGLQASFFIPDVTPPRLLSWDYDTAAGGIILNFNEPVDPDYFNYTTAVIVSKPSAWTGVGTRIVFPSITQDILNKQTDLSENLVIQLSPSKFAEVIAATDILVSSTSSYLVLYPNAVTDTSLNWYQGLDAPPSKPIQVRRYLPDTVRPLVLTVALDMTLRTLTITFTKIMILSSLNPSELSFQSQPTPTNAETLSLGPTSLFMISVKDSNVVVMGISPDLFDSLKYMPHLGHSQTTTYVYLTGKFLTDKTPSLNRVIDIVPTAAMMVTTYIPDRAQPVLDSWYADMGRNLLYLIFSEPVDTIKAEFSQQTLISAIDASAITLCNDPVVTAASVSYRLSPLTKVSSSSGHTVVLQLDDGDSANIKMRTPLCVARERCFASITSSLARDVVTYDSDGVAINNNVLPVTLLASSASFVVDKVPPLLLSYVIFMSFDGFGSLQLHFNEPVQGQNIYMGGIGLHAAALYNASYVRLSKSSYTTDSNSLMVTITMSSFDYVQLKQAGVATSENKIFLTIDSNTVTDIAGNAVGGIRGQTSSFLAPSAWYQDDFPPSIVALSLDNSLQNLTIYFNDAVLPTKVNLARFVLFSTGTGNKMALPGVRILSKSNTAALVLNLTPMLAQINSFGLLATQDDANLFIDTTGAVVDVPVQNQLVKMTASQGIRVGQTFTGFQLDLTRGLFYIFTAYPYDAKSVWDPTQTSLVSVVGGNAVAFTSRDTVANYTTDMIIMTASKDTLTNFLQSIVFADKSSVVMTFGAKAFVDRRGYSLQGGVKIPCVQLLADTVLPVLTAFALDLGLGTVTLTMSKPVQISLINLAFISLADSLDPALARTVTLAGAAVLTSPFEASSTITISLNAGSYPTLRDQLNLGSNSNIGTNVQSTYVVISKGFVGDTTVPPNYLNPISRGADVLVQDTIKPKLLSWQIDFNSRLLTVTYDEAVVAATNIATSYLLLRDPAVVTKFEFYLSPSSYTDKTVQGNTVLMHLSLEDCNTIFRMTPGLCTGPTNCFLSILQNAVSDLKGNLLAAVIHVFATLPPALFVPDRTPAVLTNYTISMQNGEADFYFDKVVDCLSADMSKLIWQYAAFLGFCNTCEYYVMEHSSPTCSGGSVLRYETHFHLNIQLADFVPMKAASRLLKSRAFTFVRPSPGFVLDTFGNPTAPVPDGSGFGPRRPDGYVGDTVRPLLLSFTISSAKVLYLQFDEPVKTASLDVTKAKFLDLQWPGTQQSYALASTLLTTFDANRTELQLAFGSDFSRMADNSRVLSRQQFTLLSIAQSFITDTSGNPVVAISNSTALQYGPSVVAWDINLVTGQLTLLFPEAMKIFAPKGLGVQSVVGSVTATKTYILTTTANATTIDSTATSWQVTLSAVDLNGIKYTQPGFANLYLTVPFNLARSVYEGALLRNLGVVARPSSGALLARILTPDTQAPKILSFHLNYNTGMLYILFDEPIQTSNFQTEGIIVVSSQVGSSATLTAASAFNLTTFEITTIAITLSDADLILTKVAARMGTLDSLIVGRGALFDLAGNAFEGNTQETPIPATVSTPDTTPPVLLAAVLDMLQGVLTLTFDELLTLGSVQPTNFAIATSSAYAGTKYVLTNATTVDQDSNGNVFLNLKIFDVDFNAIGSFASLGTTVSNTFIHFVGVADIFGNKVASRRVLQTSRVVQDTSNFTVKSFDHDPTSKTFTLYFSKTVANSAFRCADFGLLSAASATATTSMTFSAASCSIVGSADSTMLSFVYNPGTPIDATFSTVATTYLYSPSVGASLDIKGGRLAPRTAANALRVGPQIDNALLDLDKGVVTLIFTRVVNLLKLDPSKLGFYSAVSGSSTFLLSTTVTALTPTSFVAASTTVDNKGTFVLSASDINLIKALDPQPGQLFVISTEIGTAGLIEDTAGVRCAPLSVAAGNAKLVSKLTLASAPPVLQRVTVSIGTNLLAFVFSEPIRASSVVVSNFLLQSSASSLVGSYRLTGGAVTAAGVFLNITLTTFDSERIKLASGLFKAQGSSFLSLAFKTAAGFAGNYLQPRLPSDARPVDFYLPDTVPPVLLSYEVDMTLTLLTLRFSEPVQAASLVTRCVQFQSRLLARDGVNYTLTGGTVRSNDSSTLVVALSAADVTAIKTTKGLLRGTSSTYVVVKNALALDIAGNTVVNILDGRAQLVTAFTTDSINPTIVSIVMNANLGTIQFFFSEPVQTNAVNARAVTMFSSGAFDKPRTSVALSAFSVADKSQVFTSVLTLLLADRDLNTLKYRPPIMRNASTTWFTVTRELAFDVFFNPNAPITNVVATSFIPDTTPPLVVGYTVDMQFGVVLLSISESVLAASFNPSQFTMQSQKQRRFGSSVVISDSVATIGADAKSAVVSLQLSTATLNALKFNRIGTALVNALLSWTDKAFTDQVGNYVPPLWDGSIAGNTPLAPSDIRPDELSPLLQRWQIDRASMILYLYFDEPVVLLNASKIIIYTDELGTAAQSLGAVLQTNTSAALNTQIIATLRDACAFRAPGRSCAPVLVTSPTGTTSMQPPANNFFLTLLRAPATPGPFYLGLQGGAVRDFAATPNSNNPILPSGLKGLIPETPPNCGPCPAGQYTSKVCTAIADRVCALCSSCAAGSWMASRCTSSGNAVCKVCSPCQFGTYVSTPCLEASDAVCSPCTTCPDGQYQTQTCSLGRNVLCASCIMCDFPSADVQARCESSVVFTWQRANCCKDENGNTQNCDTVDVSNMIITVVKGKHREVLPDSNNVLPKA